MRNLRLLCATTFLLSSFAANANLIVNGGFESGSFSNTLANYMVLNPGDTALTGWTIDQGVAWGLNPTDGFSASVGSGFVDLSGLGNRSPTGAMSQSVSTEVGGDYLFSIDLFGGATSVFLNGIGLALVAGASSGGWTTYTSTYTAVSETTMISLRNRDGASSTVFVDEVVFSARSVAVPEPGTIGLLGIGLLGLGLVRRRKNQVTR